ncbi:hypothetical protein KAJ89_04365 [Candidatus Parcubacteria bacterium]|nr:hypothetical protein [Candidatus Parcubacteria bacterium]
MQKIIIGLLLVVLAGCTTGDKENNISICDKIDRNWKKNDCFTDVAVKFQDDSICEKIVIEKNWELDKDECYEKVGKSFNK